MYEELYEKLSPEQTDAYLARIGIDGAKPADLEFLSRLVHAHHLSVPFENLSLCDLGETVELGIPLLFDKVVTRRRGGFCFELNAIFHALLTSLGYEANGALAKVCFGRDTPSPKLHRVNLVNVDGKVYFTDVGFGGPMPHGALLLEDGHTETIMRDTFVVKKNGVFYSLCRIQDGAPFELLRFEASPREAADFITGCYFCAENPTSRFRTSRTVNMATLDGSKSINGDTFVRHVNGEVTEEPDLDETRRKEILAEEFGLVI